MDHKLETINLSFVMSQKTLSTFPLPLHHSQKEINHKRKKLWQLDTGPYF
jgi:hypothetical protein